MSAAVASFATDAPGFRIGPLTTYARPDDMARWLEAAEPGDEMIYACGPMLGNDPAKTTAAAMQAEGRVELFQRRSGKPNCWDYCAQKRATHGCPSPSVLEDGRLSRGARGSQREGRASNSGAIDRTGPENIRAQMGRLLRLLRQAAEHCQPCPSNAALAKALGLPRGHVGRRRARYLVERLTAEKRIVVTGNGRNAPRVVTIIAAGKAQGKSTGGKA